MATINLWNMRPIYWQKVIFILSIFGVGINGLAQDASFNKESHWVERNLPNYDDKLLHYGFTIGLNSTRWKPTHSNLYVQSEDSALSISAPRTTGFSLGFILNIKLGAYFDLRVLPTVAFYQRNVKYVFANNTSSLQTTESTFIEIPLLCKYKSERHGNTRMYMLAGIKGGVEAGAKKKEKKDTDLRTSNLDLCMEYGFGFDIYYQLFKFSPEIRFSHGLLNMLNKDANPYSQSLSKLTSHTITLYLHFE
jgi:hypothetical protein